MKLREHNLFAEKASERLAEENPDQMLAVKGTVTTVHGIKTRGAWQKDITPAFFDAGLRHVPLDYGYRLGPWSSAKVEEDIVAAIADQRTKVPQGPHGVVAHSFGSLCLGRAMQRNPSLSLGRICLVGSILRTDFPWREVRNRGQYESVLNEASEDDYWVRLARGCPKCIGIGTAGYNGFAVGSPFVYDRRYRGVGHSGLATRSHCEEVWVPYLVRGAVPRAEGPYAPRAG